MRFLRNKRAKALIIFCAAVILVTAGVIYLPKLIAIDVISQEETVAPEVPKFVVTHLKTPEPVKGIYMTACVAGTPSWRESMKKLVNETELNAVVIDIKDYSGTVSFREGSEGRGCEVKDLMEFIGELHDDDIYVIGRVAVFQDPLYTKLHPELAVQSRQGGIWKDHKGLSFIDVSARPYWDYIVEISKDAYAIGFDEINFDYVRYPSDGDMKDVLYAPTGTTTKPEMLKNFFSYLHGGLKETGAVLSVDLFGMTTTNMDDLNIGQLLEDTFPYFDFISPMVYPSHYPNGFNGWSDPNKIPYDIVYFSMQSAVNRLKIYNDTVASTTAQFRPWLQDNDYPVPYTPEMVRAQIQATYDVGLTSWMLWDAGNRYTRAALLTSTTTPQ